MSTARGRVEQYHSTVIVKGLKAALADAPIDGPISQFSDSHIKLNKLMYMAAAEEELLDDLHHSWHIYGSDLGDLVPATPSVTPIPFQELPQTQSPEGPSVEESDDNLPNEVEFYDFFREVSLGGLESLEEILKADRVKLLDEFYDQFSEDIEEFYDLYSYNVRLQEFLERHQEDIDVDRIGKTEYEIVNQFTRQMRDEFFKHEEFSEQKISELDLDLGNDVTEMFTDFLTLVDDIYFYLSRKQSSDIQGDASHIISEMKSFYINQAWKAVTEIISFHTIRGPRRAGLEHGATDTIQKVDSNYQIKFEQLLSECRSANIIPADPDSNGDELLSPDESVEMLKSSELLQE